MDSLQVSKLGYILFTVPAYMPIRNYRIYVMVFVMALETQ